MIFVFTWNNSSRLSEGEDVRTSKENMPRMLGMCFSYCCSLLSQSDGTDLRNILLQAFFFFSLFW